MKALILISALIFTNSMAQAYYSVFDTADSLEEGQNKAGAEFQYIEDKIPGANFIGHFDHGFGEGKDIQFLVGAGAVNFQVGGYYKYNAVPDMKDQPGMSLAIGSIYANINSAYTLSFLFHPIISKKFWLDKNSYITPYMALPLGINFSQYTTGYPVQLVFGSEWFPGSLGHASLIAEAGFELNSAFTYYSLGVSVPLDSNDKN